MVPEQTAQILLGTGIALLYAGAVLGVGILPLAMFLGRQASDAVRIRLGLCGLAWLGFIVGQGILGIVWLALSLAGTLYWGLIWSVCALGWCFGSITAILYRQQVVEAIRTSRVRLLPLWCSHSWYFWVGVGIGIVGLLRSMIALLPPWVDDALWVYLTVPKVIAFSHKLEFQPFVGPHSGLYPMQIEVHWAALFAISNETAVTVWDYLCAWSFLCGIGFLGWSLTSSRRVALLAVLMMLSTPGFYELMGGGKVDNAAAQYGVAAFLWLIFWPVLDRRSVILAGLCTGWAMAGRYTNVIVLPALMVFAVAMVHRAWEAPLVDVAIKQLKRSWAINILVGGIAAGFAGAPMLIKNWLLVGCPLAPQFGCQETFWATLYRGSRQNISIVDLLFYPFVWTFAHRADMLGNISPLFIGFLPFLLAYHRLPIVRSALIAGLAGFASVTTWLLIEPLILYTRWLLVPVGLFAVLLSASVVATEKDLHYTHTARWLIRSAILTILFFVLFQSRAAVYGVRYLASIDSRAARYEPVPYFVYDVATWLNAHVQPGQRVALSGGSGYRYFMRPDYLLHSESAEELQWLWGHYGKLSDLPSSSWTTDLWHFFTRSGFAYVVIAKDRAVSTISAWPNDIEPQIAFVGQVDAVIKIEKRQPIHKTVRQSTDSGR